MCILKIDFKKDKDSLKTFPMEKHNHIPMTR